jgi:CRP/FNR family transcriptional regulator, anaerobic regulatory protein
MNTSRLRDQMALGRQKLRRNFAETSRHILRAGEMIGTSEPGVDGIYYLSAGWACQVHEFPNGRRAILDVYLPGDVIGLEAVLRTRPLEEVLTLTSVTVQAIHSENALLDSPIALYLGWLLGQHRRRVDRLLAAVLGLDARGRMATMILDFYTRLQRRKLITGLTYNLPLTQCQIGQYLGLTVVHINRTLRSLRAQALIYLEKNCVTILDFDRLTDLARGGNMTNPSAA